MKKCKCNDCQCGKETKWQKLIKNLKNIFSKKG